MPNATGVAPSPRPRCPVCRTFEDIDVLAFTAFPVEHWPKIRSNNPQERLNNEIRRRGGAGTGRVARVVTRPRLRSGE